MIKKLKQDGEAMYYNKGTPFCVLSEKSFLHIEKMYAIFALKGYINRFFNHISMRLKYIFYLFLHDRKAYR